jgi:hypothetical protein
VALLAFPLPLPFAVVLVVHLVPLAAVQQVLELLRVLYYELP